MNPREPDVNPLLDHSGPARYDVIRAADLEPGIRSAIADAETLRARLVADAPRTWEGLVAPLDEADERVERARSAITNLDATVGSDDIRDAHRAAQALHTGYAVRLGQDEPLFRAYRDVAEGPGAAASLTAVRRKILADVLRDFRLAGVDLPAG